MISDAYRKLAFTASRFGPEPDLVVILVITSLMCLGIVMHETLGDVGWPSQDLEFIMILTTTFVVVLFMTWIQEQYLLRPIQIIQYVPRQLRRFYVQAIARIAHWVGIGHNEDKTESSLRDGMRTDTNDCFESPSERTPPHTSSDAKT